MDNNHENSRLSAIEAILERSAIENERRNAEAERMNVEAKRRYAEFEQQMMLSNAEAERMNTEAKRRHAEFEQQIILSKAEADKRAAEAQKTMENLKANIDKVGQQIKQVSQQMGGMANSNGDAAQEYFFNALYYRKTLFGQEFDEVKTEKRKIKKTGVEVQYDIILINGKSVCIVEVKYKADTNDVRRMPSMAEKFRQNYPEHANKKLYLALASMSFDDYVEKECNTLGIAMIKSLGDTIEIYDEHLKVL